MTEEGLNVDPSKARNDLSVLRKIFDPLLSKQQFPQLSRKPNLRKNSLGSRKTNTLSNKLGSYEFEQRAESEQKIPKMFKKNNLNNK